METRFDKKNRTIEDASGIGFYASGEHAEPGKHSLKTKKNETTQLNDREIAAKRTVKSNPKVKASTAKIVSKAILATRNDMQ